jgi:lipoate-protein ligase B
VTDRICRIADLGRMAHEEAEALQLRLVAARRAGTVPDSLLLVEHDPVVTLGSAVDEPTAEVSVDLLEAAGAQVRRVSRGGRATFHGPGQVVGYPILDLRSHRQDLHWYLRAVEEVLIGALREFGYEAQRVEGFTGVWVSGRKVASIGIAVRGWVTYHGFALNVDCDPMWWTLLNPCGLQAEQMASLSGLGRSAPGRGEIHGAIVRHLMQVLELQARHCTGTELLAEFDF